MKVVCFSFFFFFNLNFPSSMHRTVSESEKSQVVGPQGGLIDRDIIQVILAKLSKQKTHGVRREKA